MNTNQSNILPNLRPLVNWNKGENYVVNGCWRFLMERVKPDFPIETDYEFFSAITGEASVQIYARGFKGAFNGNDLSLSGIWDGKEFCDYIFNEIGYGYSYVTNEQIEANKLMYVEMVKSYIDKGIPVMQRWVKDKPNKGSCYTLIVGYEDCGETLLFLDGDNTEPDRWSFDDKKKFDWIFIGEKERDVDKTELYANALKRAVALNTMPDRFGASFGAKAFRDWADDIESGYYANGGKYATYVCLLSTNASHHSSYYILDKMPGFGFLKQIGERYGKRLAELWGELETLGGGFNVTNEVMQDVEKRGQIADVVRECAVQTEGVLWVLGDGVKSISVNPLSNEVAVVRVV
jgi:hypothetical protein